MPHGIARCLAFMRRAYKLSNETESIRSLGFFILKRRYAAFTGSAAVCAITLEYITRNYIVVHHVKKRRNSFSGITDAVNMISVITVIIKRVLFQLGV